MRTGKRILTGLALFLVVAACHGPAARLLAQSRNTTKPSPFSEPPAPVPGEAATAAEASVAPGAVSSAARVQKTSSAPGERKGAPAASSTQPGLLDFLDAFQIFSGESNTAAGKQGSEPRQPAPPDNLPGPHSLPVVPSSTITTAQAAPVSSLSGNMHGTMHLMAGKSLVIDSAARIQRISIANAEVAEAVAVSPRELVVHGKSPGETSLVLWQEGGRRQLFDLRVAAAQMPVDDLRTQIRAALKGEDVDVQIVNERVILTGTVSDIVTARRAEAVAATFGRVVNLLNVKIPEVEPQILLKVRFANIDRSVSRERGFNLFSLGYGNTVGSATTQQFAPPRWRTNSDEPLLSFSDALNLFLLRTDLNLGATIRLLQAQRILQILAEPNLLTINGKKASFLAGGEFPFPIVQGGANVGAVTITFREFGIRINFTPVITARGTIRLKVSPEVSSLDFANALLIQGFTVPAINTRRVETEVELEAGQSFAIAGLLDQRTQDVLSKVPGVGDIPILGKLFQSRGRQQNDSELLVVVTPEFVRPIPKGNPTPEVEMPETFLRPGAKPQVHPGLDVTGPVPVEPSRRTVPYESLKEELQRQGLLSSPTQDATPSAPTISGDPDGPSGVAAPAGGASPAGQPVPAAASPVATTALQ